MTGRHAHTAEVAIEDATATMTTEEAETTLIVALAIVIKISQAGPAR